MKGGVVLSASVGWKGLMDLLPSCSFDHDDDCHDDDKDEVDDDDDADATK